MRGRFIAACSLLCVASVQPAVQLHGGGPSEYVYATQITTVRPGQRPVSSGPGSFRPGTGPIVVPQQQQQQPFQGLPIGLGAQTPVQQQQAPPPGQQPPPATRPMVTRATQTGSGMIMGFDNAPLHAFINTIMQQLGYNYVIDPSVNGTVNLYTTQNVRQEDLFTILEYVLRLNNVTITRKGDVFLIVPEGKGITSPHEVVSGLLRGARSTPGQPPVPSPSPATAPVGAPPAPFLAPDMLDLQGLVTYIVPMHYIPSSEMVELVKPFLSGGSSIISYDKANILLVSETRANMQKILQIITALDTNYFDINTVDLINIRYNKASDIVKDLTKVFSGGNDAAALGMSLVPIDRLNSVLVIAHSTTVMEEVRSWIERLDSPSGGQNFQTFIYEVQNSTAANIAEIVSLLYSDGMGFPSTNTAEAGQAGTAAGGAAPGQAGSSQQAQAQQQRQSIRPQESQGGRRDPSRSGLSPSLGGRKITEQTSASSSLLGSNVKVVVNEFNNSLVIQASEADYRYLRRTIEQLDTLPRQVLIEAKIYSVELRDELSFGVAAFLELCEQKAAATTASISPGSSTTPAGILAATAFRIGQARQIDAVITALRSKTNVKILQAPKILTMDGQQATLNVGAEVPVTTSSFGDPVQSGSAGAFLNQIQFRQTGTTLLISPRISATGIVTMDIAVEVSSPVGAGLTPTINRNFVETSLIVQDGQSIAIAGIISDEHNLDRRRVPLLGDIPILGALFGATSRTIRRTELIILITPKVMRDIPTALEVTDWFRRSLKNSYDFMREKDEEARRLDERRQRQELRDK